MIPFSGRRDAGALLGEGRPFVAGDNNYVG